MRTVHIAPWLKSALHASSHPCMCTCVLRLGCFLFISPVFYFVPPFSFQPFLMFTSEFNERSRSNPLCDFRLGTVATSDHETPLTMQTSSKWMQDRQADLQDASRMVNVSEVTRLRHVIAETASGIPICRFAVHGDEFHQDGAVRVVRWSPETQWPEAREVPIWGFRGVRVGEASNPGPASKRRRTQRLRALQRSMDSDSEDDMPLVSTGPEVFAMSSDIGDTVRHRMCWMLWSKICARLRAINQLLQGQM